MPSAPGPTEALASVLDAGWAQGLASGIVAYDPARAVVRRIGKFAYRAIAGRETRPRTRIAPLGEFGVQRPHEPCAFDSAEFLAERELVRLAIDGREYHVIANRFPVAEKHFVVIRPVREPAAALTQSILAASEIVEMAALIRVLGPPYRIYFNSNRGRDGSSSGSSINHWHYQFLAYPGATSPAEEYAGEPVADFAAAGASSRAGTLRGWPALARVFEGADLADLAGVAWSALGRILGEDRAYNVEVRCAGDDRVRIYLYPKAPAAPVEIPGLGNLSADFGGIEMAGDIVLPGAEYLRWFEEHPDEGERLTAARLFSTTRL